MKQPFTAEEYSPNVSASEIHRKRSKFSLKLYLSHFLLLFSRFWSLYLIWKNLTVFWYRDDVVIPVDGHQTIIGEFLLFGKFFKGTKFFMFSCCIGLFEDFLEVPASSRPSILSSLPPPPNPENIVRKNTNKTIIKRFINLKDILFSNFLYCLHQTEKSNSTSTLFLGDKFWYFLLLNH